MVSVLTSALTDGAMDGLVEGEYIYVGFDLERTGIAKNVLAWMEYADALANVVCQLRGVNKVWFKVRPEQRSAEEVFTYFPNPADEYFAHERPVSKEMDWQLK